MKCQQEYSHQWSKMNLIDLITYFKESGNITKFYIENQLNLDSEVIEVYMQKPFDFEKEIHFFELEITEGLIEYIHEDVKYFNLFDFDYFFDYIEESNNELNKLKTNNDLAKILFNYSLNDA